MTLSVFCLKTNEIFIFSDGVLNARVYPHGQFHPDENIDPRLVDSQLFSRACFLNPATMGQLEIKLATLIALTLDEKEYTGVAWECMVLFRTRKRESSRCLVFASL